MKKEYKIEQVAETRWFYEFIETNKKGEKIVIEFSLCEDDPEYKNSLPKLWYKNGYIDRVLSTYWAIQTYVTDTEGACWGRYNPHVKRSEDGKRSVINFDWMLEATEENKQKVIDEVYRLASTATGETATEIKIKKIYEFANKYGIEVVTEIPDGWRDVGGFTCPIGSTFISNMENFKSSKRQTKLLLV